MSKLRSAVVVAYSPDEGVLCHGMVISSQLWLPLHVLDQNAWLPSRRLKVVGPSGNYRLDVTTAMSCPQADLAIYTLLDLSGEVPPTLVAPTVGQEVKILAMTQTLPFHAVPISARVRAMVSVDHYSYRTGSGVEAAAQDLLVTFLDVAAYPGLSGAPVLTANESAIVGFIHGNAPDNDGLAILLDPACAFAISSLRAY